MHSWGMVEKGVHLLYNSMVVKLKLGLALDKTQKTWCDELDHVAYLQFKDQDSINNFNEMHCAICYQFYNLKNVKNTHRIVLLLD